MDSVTLLADAQAAGLSVRAAGDRLVVRGPRAAEHLARRLLARKEEVLPLLHAEEAAQAEIGWRAAALRPQVPPSGPIPFLVARDSVGANGRCLSCGDALEAGAQYRCRWCVRAVLLVLNEVREGVVPPPPGTSSAAPTSDDGSALP